MKMCKSRSWQKEATGVDGNVQLFGVNIFDYDWLDTKEKVNIGALYDFNVFEVNINGKIKRFAAGEVSNCVWEFYIYKF
jgi:hypothetical protein